MKKIKYGMVIKTSKDLIQLIELDSDYTIVRSDTISDGSAAYETLELDVICLVLIETDNDENCNLTDLSNFELSVTSDHSTASAEIFIQDISNNEFGIKNQRIAVKTLFDEFQRLVAN